jgi:hypothetical protein
MGKRDREIANMLPVHGKGRGKRHSKVDDERPHIFPANLKKSIEKKLYFLKNKTPLPKTSPKLRPNKHEPIAERKLRGIGT